MRVVWSLLHGSAVEVADLGKREDLVRIGCVDRAEVERMLQPRCEVGLLVSEYLGTESMIRALRVNQVDFALMDSVEAFLRKDEGLVSELMIGGEEYELVVNSRGSSGQVEQGRGKLRVGVDDFGKSLMLGKGGLAFKRSQPEWEMVRMPSESLEFACEQDLIQGFFRLKEGGSYRRELALVRMGASVQGEGFVSENGPSDFRSKVHEMEDLRDKFDAWEGCGSVKGMFVVGKRWEGWVSAKLRGVSKTGKAKRSGGGSREQPVRKAVRRV